MLVQDIDNKTLWEGFLEGVRERTFLQSWDWGQFQEQRGDRIWRWGIYEGQELLAVALIIKVAARRGNFLFIPHGPVLRGEDAEHGRETIQAMTHLFQELRALAQKERCAFIRVSPILTDSEEHRSMFAGLGFRPAPMHMHAELTWILDLTPSPEELFSGMRKTTRNLVRRGEREGVTVEFGSLREFYDIYRETVKRQQFVAFSYEYLEKEMEAFGQDAQVFIAKHQGNALAGALIVFHAQTAYYHHGASLHSSVPAAYTLQWEIIKEAKKRGMKQYNFWGVVPESDTNHPWWGLSLFKRGFGGREWNLLHAQDLALSWKYYLSWSVETLRKWKRGY